MKSLKKAVLSVLICTALALSIGLAVNASVLSFTAGIISKGARYASFADVFLKLEHFSASVGKDTSFSTETVENGMAESDITEKEKSDSEIGDNTAEGYEALTSDTSAESVYENSTKLTEDEYNAKVAELIARLYAVKAEFTSKLSELESKAISEYNALPEEERNFASKSRIVSENMTYAAGLEASCDAQVNAITDELYTLMTENGKDTALVEQIKAEYQKEKNNRINYYMGLLN